MSIRFFLLFIISIGLVACTTGGSRYPRYPQYPQYPQTPGYYGNDSMRILADSLKAATTEVVEEAKENTTYTETTVTTLEELDQEAKNFYDNVGDRNDRYRYEPYGYPSPPYGDPRYGNRGNGNREHFTELLQKYYTARRTLREAASEDEVQKEFDRVTSIMRNLTRLHGYRFEPDYEYSEPTIR
jgi:hypothetical protein